MIQQEKSKFTTVALHTIVVALITYFLLFLTTDREVGHEHLWDRNTYQQEKTGNRQQATGDLYSDEIEALVNDAISDYHQSAPSKTEKTYQTICKTYQDICSITTFETNKIDAKQKLYYQVMIIYALRKLEGFGIPYSDYIDNISISSESAKSRGRSSRNQIMLDVKAMQSYAEFLQVLLHELGHITDFRYLIGDESASKSKVFTEFGKVVFPVDDPSLEFYALSWINENTRSKFVTYKDFVSGYSMVDPFEDLAEVLHLYINYNQIFQKISQQSDILRAKYEFMEELFGGQYISLGTKAEPVFENYDRDYRPYDTTRP